MMLSRRWDFALLAAQTPDVPIFRPPGWGCVGYSGHPFLKRGRERSEDRIETVAIFVSHKKYIDLFPRSSLLVGRSQDLRKNAKSSK